MYLEHLFLGKIIIDFCFFQNDCFFSRFICAKVTYLIDTYDNV